MRGQLSELNLVLTGVLLVLVIVLVCFWLWRARVELRFARKQEDLIDRAAVTYEDRVYRDLASRWSSRRMS